MEKIPNSDQEGAQEVQRHLDFLKKERDDCIDDLPKERVVPSDPNYHKYKCRTNWWQGILSRFRYLLEDGLIKDEGVSDSVEAFIKFAMEEIDFTKFRVKEEIDQANEILDLVISHLESSK